MLFYLFRFGSVAVSYIAHVVLFSFFRFGSAVGAGVATPGVIGGPVDRLKGPEGSHALQAQGHGAVPGEAR